MFKMQLAQYISENMVRHQLTYKDIATRSGVPPTTLSYYARGQVNTPNDDYCIRIAAVFGDGPEVINDMRRAALISTAKENEAIAKSSDVESAEKLAALMRVNMLVVLDEYKAGIEADHAKRVDTVRSQYEGHIKNIEARCQEKMDMQEKYFNDLLDLERTAAKMLNDQNKASKEYLKTVIHNLSVSLAIASLLAVSFGMYSVFAYRTFDMHDLSKGLAQDNHTAVPFLIALVIVCVVVFFGGKFVFAKKMFEDKKEKRVNE